jgi:hypothetical protein
MKYFARIFGVFAADKYPIFTRYTAIAYPIR